MSYNERYLIEWGKIYEKKLQFLLDDIELASLEDSRIFLAIDFCDLFEHCIPSIRDYLSDEYDVYRKEFYKRELVRFWIFNYTSIYSKHNSKIILFPPYLAEVYDFFKYYNKKINDASEIFYNTERRLQIQRALNQFNDIKDIDFDNMDEIGRYQLLRRLGSNILELSFIFGPLFQRGINELKDLLKRKMTLCPNEINGFMDIILRTYDEDVANIFEVFEEDRPGRLMQNYRDSRAIQYLEEVNKSSNKNDIIILISSADTVKRISEKIISKEYKDVSITCEKKISTKTYYTVRDLEPFRFAFLELSNHFGERYLDIISGYPINYQYLISRLKDDLSIVEKISKRGPR
jgi:hypothetical protein